VTTALPLSIEAPEPAVLREATPPRSATSFMKNEMSVCRVDLSCFRAIINSPLEFNYELIT
jgi:hypothetical protein